jgi:hypothetical protein
MTYTFKDSKPALVFEVFLPKRMHYASKLAEVLDAFLSKEGILSIPVIKELIERRKDDPPEKNAQLLETIKATISGYSIYEVDGRVESENGPIDERTWVIRFIIHDPSTDEGIRSEFHSMARSVIDYLIAQRFAAELGTEGEIWVLEYQHCSLRRWVKK